MHDPENLAAYALSGYPPEIGRWLWALEDTRRRTKQVLQDMPAAILDWAPRQQSNSIGSLLYHIAAIELDWLYTEILQRDLPPETEVIFPYDVRDAAGSLSSVASESIDIHLARLDQTRATFLAELKTLTVDDFRRPRQLATYSVTPEWAIHHLIQHEAEHRGQIAELRTLAVHSGRA